MTFTKYGLLFLFCFTLVSCESEISQKETCNDVVKLFIANLPLDNYDILYKHYPDFRFVKKYWKVSDFRITNSVIDEGGEVSVVGISEQLGNLSFTLKKVDRKFIIINSKGLASVFDKPIYKYCKTIGCIGVKDYDKDISQICSEKEDEFNSLVFSIKSKIEENFLILNDNLSVTFGYVSGRVTLKNYSRFTIPAGTYELYYDFIDYNGNVIFTKPEISTYQTIGFGQSVSFSLFENISQSFTNIRARLKLVSTGFIEKVIADNIMGENCVADSNL